MAKEQNQEDTNEVVGKDAKIFSGLSAWFSSSVRPKTTGLWVALGGLKHPVETADYLFSCDVTSSDTASIFSSSLYQRELVAIVHPSYIHACILAEDMMKVTLGYYILYPKVFEEIFLHQKASSSCYSRIKHIEGQDYCQNNTNSIHEGKEAEEEEEEEDREEEEEEEEEDGEEEEEEEEEEDGEEEGEGEEEIEDNQPIDKNSQIKKDDKSCVKSRQQQQTMSCSGSQSPCQSKYNKKISDIVSITELEKVSGSLELFIPGKAGCQVIYKS